METDTCKTISCIIKYTGKNPIWMLCNNLCIGFDFPIKATPLSRTQCTDLTYTEKISINKFKSIVSFNAGDYPWPADRETIGLNSCIPHHFLNRASSSKSSSVIS